MILIGTFVFGVLVGCFIERRRLGLTSRYSSDCCHLPKNTQISCVCCRRASATTRYKQRRISPSQQKRPHFSRSRVTFVPTKSRLFIPRSQRREMSPFRRPRSRSRRSRSKRSLIRFHSTPSLSVTNLSRNHYYDQPPDTRKPGPGQLSAVNVTNLINESSSRPTTSHQPSKRWTEGMLYRKPRGHLRPRSLGRTRHPGYNSPRYY